MFRFCLVLLLALAPATAKTPPATSTMPAKRPPDREVGERLYRQSCWQCHGTNGKGDGPAASALVGGVPSLEGKVLDETIESLIDVVQAGRGPMPAYNEVIDRQDTRRILLYLQDRLAGKSPTSDEPAEDAAEEDADAR